MKFIFDILLNKKNKNDLSHDGKNHIGCHQAGFC